MTANMNQKENIPSLMPISGQLTNISPCLSKAIATMRSNMTGILISFCIFAYVNSNKPYLPIKSPIRLAGRGDKKWILYTFDRHFNTADIKNTIAKSAIMLYVIVDLTPPRSSILSIKYLYKNTCKQQ